MTLCPRVEKDIRAILGSHSRCSAFYAMRLGGTDEKSICVLCLSLFDGGLANMGGATETAKAKFLSGKYPVYVGFRRD